MSSAKVAKRCGQWLGELSREEQEMDNWIRTSHRAPYKNTHTGQTEHVFMTVEQIVHRSFGITKFKLPGDSCGSMDQDAGLYQ